MRRATEVRLASPSASRRKRLVYLGIAVVLLGQSIIYYSTGVGQGLMAFVGLLAGICLVAFALTSEFNCAVIGPNRGRGEKYQLGLHKLFKDKGNISNPLMPKLPWD